MIEDFEWQDNWIAENTVLEYVTQLVSLINPNRFNTEEISAVTISNNKPNTRFSPNQRFVPVPSETVLIFADRYNERVFPKVLSYEEYLKDCDIQDLIDRLELDKDKFWFAILFAYDYSTHTCLEGYKKKESACEQIHKFVDRISEYVDNVDEYFGTKLKAPLTLTLSNGKKKENITIDSESAIGYILGAVQERMQKEPLENYYAYTYHQSVDETVDLGVSMHITYFARLLLTVLDNQPQVRSKRKKGAKHSHKEIDLVCKLIYFTCISREKSWLQSENENLKSYLRQYTRETGTFNSVYPAFNL